MNRMQASNGLFAVAPMDGLVSPDYAVFKKIADVNLDYVSRLCKLPNMKIKFRAESKGLGTGTSGFLRLYSDRFGAIRIALPPLEQQDHIVRYVRHKEAQIAKFIQAKRKLIALLSEQKQAIINQAVTRGLDANVRLKPSGVDYLGDIPEHWEVRRLRNLASIKLSNVDKVINEGEESVPLCNYVDVYHNEYITEDLNFMQGSATGSEIAKFSLLPGDVIITKDSETWEDIAVPAFVPEKIHGLVCGYHLAVIRHSEEIYGEYLFRCISSYNISQQFKIAANGVTRYGLSQGPIKSSWMPLPPLEEQEQIIAHIKEASKAIQSAIQKAKTEIDLIREYRTRLISDVVTGKLDVRGIEVEDVDASEVLDDLDEAEDDALLEEAEENLNEDD